jgi:hypothetical protein
VTPLNECAACFEDFTSLETFDRHRVGSHEPDERRCLDIAAMTAKGWAKDPRGRWFDPARAQRARQAFEAVAA